MVDVVDESKEILIKLGKKKFPWWIALFFAPLLLIPLMKKKKWKKEKRIVV